MPTNPFETAASREIPVTPYVAAQQGFGAGKTVHVTRYRLDGTRCGLNTGRHAEWNWAYKVAGYDLGRGLIEARQFAARLGDRVVESWPGGKSFTRGPNGGLTRAS